MSRTKEFLATYNQIDTHLRQLLNVDTYVNFAKLVRDAAGINRVVASHQKDLLLIAKLRNLIVHEQKKPDFFIVEPHHDIVEIAVDVLNTLEKPPLVVPTFQRSVVTFTNTDCISVPLTFIRDNDYSQFPVYDEAKSFMGLLTERCIARWLAHQVRVDEERMLIEKTTIGDVLCLQEIESNACFLPRAATVYEAQELFMQNKLLDAILITKDNNPNNFLLGIITLWDILSINL
jgi:predicted transcriptional regulator